MGLVPRENVRPGLRMCFRTALTANIRQICVSMCLKSEWTLYGCGVCLYGCTRVLQRKNISLWDSHMKPVFMWTHNPLLFFNRLLAALRFPLYKTGSIILQLLYLQVFTCLVCQILFFSEWPPGWDFLPYFSYESVPAWQSCGEEIRTSVSSPLRKKWLGGSRWYKGV